MQFEIPMVIVSDVHKMRGESGISVWMCAIITPVRNNGSRQRFGVWARRLDEVGGTEAAAAATKCRLTIIEASATFEAYVCKGHVWDSGNMLVGIKDGMYVSRIWRDTTSPKSDDW